MKDKYNWALLGTGIIADEMAQAFKKSGREIYSVGSRNPDNAYSFAKRHNVKKAYGDFRQIFDDNNVDIIYIATPQNAHLEYICKALENGKSVLCEKSITQDSNELYIARDAAVKSGAFLAEAMTIYHMPLYKKLISMQADGVFGKVNMIQLNFGSYKEYNMENRFFNKKMAGGAMLDIGVYAISLARMFMSEKPDRLLSQVKYAPSGVDEQVGILMMNSKEQMGVISLSFHSKQPKRAVISCDKAYIEIMEYPRSDEAAIVYTATGEKEIIKCGDSGSALCYEIEDMEKTVSGSEDLSFLKYSTDVMEIMTDIRKQWK